MVPVVLDFTRWVSAAEGVAVAVRDPTPPRHRGIARNHKTRRALPYQHLSPLLSWCRQRSQTPLISHIPGVDVECTSSERLFRFSSPSRVYDSNQCGSSTPTSAAQRFAAGVSEEVWALRGRRGQQVRSQTETEGKKTIGIGRQPPARPRAGRHAVACAALAPMRRCVWFIDDDSPVLLL